MKTIRSLHMLSRVPGDAARKPLLLFLLGILFIVALSSTSVTRAQDPSMPGMQMPHQPTQASAQSNQIEFPQLGRDQENAKAGLFTVENALQAAKENNPTFRQAEAGVKAAHARAQQAGLYLNPIVGYAGDEIRGGEIKGGKQGFFVEQTIVTGGKLARARAVMNKDLKLAEAEAEEQQVRVETAVKMAFYRVLAAQEMAHSRADLARIAGDILWSQQRLHNTGQADDTEVLTAEVEAHRMKLFARMKENTLREDWRSLSACMGQPDLALQTVAGHREK